MPVEAQAAPWKERRSHLRLARSFPLTLLDTSKRLLDMDIKLLDISRTGFGFTTMTPRSPGETILFRLDLPGQGMIAGQAVTRWAGSDGDKRRYFAGAEIQSMAWGDSYKLRRFINISAGRNLSLFDYILMVGCVVIALWITHDGSLGMGSAGGQMFILDLFSWIPQLGVITIGAFGIYLLFNRIR